VDVAITLTGADAAENLRALRTWLVGEPELRGRVHLAERPPEPGQLGTVPELLSVTLGSGATVTGLTTSVIAWLRYRTSDVSCTVTKADGASITMSAQRVRNSDMAAQQELMREFASVLSGDATSATESETPQPER
jgi:hypothetical protein